jgi:hypothetical protein
MKNPIYASMRAELSWGRTLYPCGPKTTLIYLWDGIPSAILTSQVR